METLKVKHLSKETIEDLSHALEKPTLNWEELMGSNTIASIYSASPPINKIRMTGNHPAKALIDELDSKEIALKDLLRGLTEIGNVKAISIIKRGTLSHGLRWLKQMKYW